MGIMKRLFSKQDTVENKATRESKEDSSFVIKNDVGSSTGSAINDYYVYEWYIRSTGEIFYIGKGRGDNYKEYHEREYEAEKIRKLYDTEIRFVANYLTEEQALEIEMQEMTRVLTETTNRLTNRSIPYVQGRDNGYSKDVKTPAYKFETAPVLYASEIQAHYYQTTYRPFDQVEFHNLQQPAFIDKIVSKDQIDTIYGGNLEKYYREVVTLLEQSGSKIIKSKYAKSVTAWIYLCDDYVTNYELDEVTAEERIGRRIPAYHLIDVWKELRGRYGDAVIQKELPIMTHPIHNRVPLDKIKHLKEWDKGFDEGFYYWKEGEAERKAGNLEHAIELFDKARYEGYFSSALYESYAKAYRSLSDTDNEIAILDEAIKRFNCMEGDQTQMLIWFEERKRKIIEKRK